MPALILVRGAGDLASGVTIRLLRSGLKIVLSELSQPLAVRRTVAFSEAVYEGLKTVEGFTARRVQNTQDSSEVLRTLSNGQTPVLLDPACACVKWLHPLVIVDARMTKQPAESIGYEPALYIGLGPGFIAGQNCQVAVETRRGHNMGRVYWEGGPDPDTKQPEGDIRRVLRAPSAGKIKTCVEIGQIVEENALICEVHGQPVVAPFRGLLRGLLRSDVQVTVGMKIGDLDHRLDTTLCKRVSDKSLAVGGGVLEAILSQPLVRNQLWN